MKTIRQKFSEECTDRSLEKYDTLIIPVTTYGTRTVHGPITFSGITIDDVNIRGDIQYCSSDGTILADKPTSMGFYLSTAAGNGEIVVENMYSITSLFTNFDGFGGNVDGIKLNLEQLEYMVKVTDLFIQGARVKGDVYYLRNMKGSPTGFQSIAYGSDIMGSLSYLPKTVSLIYGYNYYGEGFTWITGVRNNSSCCALYLRSNIKFKTQEDLCNFLLDNAKCNPYRIEQVNMDINCSSKDGVTTLNSAVRSAMAMMCAAKTIPNANSVSGYCWGLSNLIINGTTYTSQDGINLDQ